MAVSKAVPERIFVAWLGDNPMSQPRSRALEAIKRLGHETVLVTQENLSDWVVPNAPLPRSYELLTAIQQADVLRCYLMHHHGGGYTDIKAPTDAWHHAFKEMSDQKLLAMGYPEVRGGVATLGADPNRRLQVRSSQWWRYQWLRVNRRRLIGNCAFIFRPQTDLTEQWWRDVTERLETVRPLLEARPARYPRERRGHVEYGAVSDYPVPWSYLGGDSMQPLILRFHKQIGRKLPAPSFTDYL